MSINVKTNQRNLSRFSYNLSVCAINGGRRKLGRRHSSVQNCVCGSSGAAAENHHSIVVPTVRPRSQISDNDDIALARISILLLCWPNLAV